MMDKLIELHNICVKLPIEFDPKTETCYGKNTFLIRSYATYIGCNKTSILIDD